MKRILRIGEGYAFSKHKLKHAYIQYFSLLAVATIMCLYAVKQVSAQQAEPAATAVADIKPLQIGDTIPEWLWHLPLKAVNQPEGSKVITLNDYRGKTILLDFLSTGCGGCTKALPGLEKVSSAFNGEVAVIAVTPENRQRVARFIQNNSYVREVQLPFVVEDIALKQHFPHLYISHVAWIDAKGIVRAFTGSGHVTARTIRELQSGETGDWPVKTETTEFFNAPLFTLNAKANALPNNAKRHLYYAALTGYTEGSGPYIATNEDSVRGIERIAYKNRPVLDLYRIAIGSGFPLDSNIVWEVENPFRYAPHKADLSLMTRSEWDQQNALCYEAAVPMGTPAAVWKAQMFANLNVFLGLNCRMEERNGVAVFIVTDR